MQAKIPGFPGPGRHRRAPLALGLAALVAAVAPAPRSRAQSEPVEIIGDAEAEAPAAKPADKPAGKAAGKQSGKQAEKPAPKPAGKARSGGKVVSVRDGDVRLRGPDGLRPNDLVYVVGKVGSTNGLVAELVVRKVNPARGTALAGINTLREGTTAAQLKGLSVITQRMARARLDHLQLGAVTAATSAETPEAAAAAALLRDPAFINRNPTVAVSFRVERAHVRLLQGAVGAQPETALSGVDLELFAPALPGSEWLGFIGLSATLLSAAPATVQGRLAGADATQDARVESREETIRLVFRPVLPLRILSRVEVAFAVSDRTVQTVTFESGGERLGRAALAAKGLGLRVGVWSAPYDNVFLAMSWDAPLTRQLGVTQDDARPGGTGARSATGTYRRSDLDLWSALRWPRADRRHALALELSGGVTIRDERVYAKDVTGRDEQLFLDTVPWLGLGGSYAY